MIAIRRGAPLAACLMVLCAGPVAAQQANMSFFVTSSPIGKGADLGGLVGADKHCQTLAAAVGAGAKTWRAYLSTQGGGAVNARDRIGKGPWVNAKGVVVAKDVAELHGTNNLTKQTVLTEKGEINNGRGDTPNRHDILTGSQPDGSAFPPDKDMTCKNWTSSTEGSAMLGHADRMGLREDDASHSVELVASLARLHTGRPAFDRRRRAAVLLRGELGGYKPGLLRGRPAKARFAKRAFLPLIPISQGKKLTAISFVKGFFELALNQRTPPQHSWA